MFSRSRLASSPAISSAPLIRPALFGGRLLGREHDIPAIQIAQRRADQRLGAIALGRIDEVDAQLERAPHDRHRLRLGRAGLLAQAAMPAAAEPAR